MTVVPFKRPQRAGPLAGKVEPPAALGSIGRTSGASEETDEVDYRLRTQQNLGALAVVIIIVVLGGWMIDQLRTYSRIRACFEVGHRNCMPLNIDPPGTR